LSQIRLPAGGAGTCTSNWEARPESLTKKEHVPVETNPRRVAAGRANRLKRGPLTDDGRRRLSEAALRDKPWLHATGPITAVGRARSAQNGREHQRGPLSVRQARAALKEVRALIQAIQASIQWASRA
jgi:hypothetical protein